MPLSGSSTNGNWQWPNRWRFIKIHFQINSDEHFRNTTGGFSDGWLQLTWRELRIYSVWLKAWRNHWSSWCSHPAGRDKPQLNDLEKSLEGKTNPLKMIQNEQLLDSNPANQKWTSARLTTIKRNTSVVRSNSLYNNATLKYISNTVRVRK